MPHKCDQTYNTVSKNSAISKSNICQLNETLLRYMTLLCQMTKNDIMIVSKTIA